MNNPFERPLPNSMSPEAPDEERLDGISHEQLLHDALAKAEGFIMYAPIDITIRKSLLNSLTITDEARRELGREMAKNQSTPAQCAATVLQRRLRPAVDAVRGQISSRDYTLLSLGVERLALNGPSTFDDLYKQWMNSPLTK